MCFRSISYRTEKCCFQRGSENHAGVFEVTTLAARLQQEETIAREYLATDGHWHMGRFIVKQRDANGTVTEVLYVARDITEEKSRSSNIRNS